MIYTLPYKTKQFFFVLIKLSIVVGAFYFIYEKLANNPELDFLVFIDFSSKNNVFILKNLLFLLFLTIFNWFFEILKWQVLASHVKKTGFKNALEQSLGSLTASLFTPNRIGEYGAKAIFFTTRHRKRIVLTNLLGNVMQMSVTIIFGLIGLCFFIKEHPFKMDYFILFLLLLMSFLVLIFIGFGIRKHKSPIKGFSFEKIKYFILNFAKTKLFFGFSLAVLRYVIFSFQFYCLLHIFGVDITYLNAMVVISTMYLLTSIFPSIFIFDVIIKGSVAVFLFTIIGVEELTILSVVLLMWLHNFVLPSVFGSFYVLHFKLPEHID